MGKSVDIYMTFYIGDYLKKTTMLSCEEHGAYILLLFSLWQNGGSLPLDHAKLARICRLSIKKWETIWKNISEFFEIENFQITNRRVSEEIKLADLRRVRAQANGAMGGRPQKEKPTWLPSGLPTGEPTEEAKPNQEKSSSFFNLHIEEENKQRRKKIPVAFNPPTYDEVFEYMKGLALKSSEDGYKGTEYYRFPKEMVPKFFDWYNSCGWEDRDGRPILNWKQKLITWVNKWLEKNPKTMFDSP